MADTYAIRQFPDERARTEQARMAWSKTAPDGGIIESRTKLQTVPQAFPTGLADHSSGTKAVTANPAINANQSQSMTRFERYQEAVKAEMDKPEHALLANDARYNLACSIVNKAHPELLANEGKSEAALRDKDSIRQAAHSAGYEAEKASQEAYKSQSTKGFKAAAEAHAAAAKAHKDAADKCDDDDDEEGADMHRGKSEEHNVLAMFHKGKADGMAANEKPLTWEEVLAQCANDETFKGLDSTQRTVKLLADYGTTENAVKEWHKLHPVANTDSDSDDDDDDDDNGASGAASIFHGAVSAYHAGAAKAASKSGNKELAGFHRIAQKHHADKAAMHGKTNGE